MQNTTNLNLKKPEYTDFADIEDINDNMDTIDEKLHNTKDSVVAFTSSDVADGSATAWTTVTKLATGEKHSSLFAKMSQMFKNVRYLYKLLGTTDISSIGNGTVTNALSVLNANLVRQYYLGDVTGRATILVPSNWEYVFFDVWIDGSKRRIIPFTLPRGTIAIGDTYELRNGYYGDPGNYAYVSVAATYSADYTLSLGISSVSLTGTDYTNTSRLSVNYMYLAGRA